MAELRLFLPGHGYGPFFAAILAVNLAGNAAAAFAQTPPPPDKPQSQIPEKVAPPLQNGKNEKNGEKNGANQNKLQREDGVLKPPGDIDPGMTEKPPETGGRMPVIPPPGSPGGNPSVQPK
ncbi:MAG: hypothetical protein J2P49_10035 [Methylocapsa sp.]|nr:hypothetical protein [Methylocapsa sp.]